MVEGGATFKLGTLMPHMRHETRIPPIYKEARLLTVYRCCIGQLINPSFLYLLVYMSPTSEGAYKTRIEHTRKATPAIPTQRHRQKGRSFERKKTLP